MMPRSRMSRTQTRIHSAQACELYSVPDHTPLDMGGRGPAFSSFASGFLPPPRPSGEDMTRSWRRFHSGAPSSNASGSAILYVVDSRCPAPVLIAPAVGTQKYNTARLVPRRHAAVQDRSDVLGIFPGAAVRDLWRARAQLGACDQQLTISYESSIGAALPTLIDFQQTLRLRQAMLLILFELNRNSMLMPAC